MVMLPWSRMRFLLEDVMLVLWFGSLWAAGLLVAPILFRLLPSVLAANVAGQLFQISHVIGIACSLGLMAWFWRRQRRLVVVISLLCLLMLLNLLWVMPQVASLRGSVNHASFVVWHSISSLIYLLECLGALWVLWLRHVTID